MSPQTHLRLEHLLLRNFRCFEECAIDLHPELIVLVAENGRGKTAILDAMRIGLGLFVDSVAGTRQSGGFERADVRLVRGENGRMVPALPTEFVADGYVSGQAIHWSRALKSYGLSPRMTTKDAEDLCHAAVELRKSVEGHAPVEAGGAPVLPLVAFYGTGRLFAEHWLGGRKRTYVRPTGGRLAGYADCLSLASSFKGLVAWYEDKANEIQDPKFSAELSENLRLLAAVKEATRVVLEPTQWSELDWDFERKSLVIQHPDHGRLPLSALSDGVRNTVALIADIARRCATLNPHMGNEAALRTPGVLLIDEVDMHLHPRWQQLVIGLLQKAFPEVQMVLSTHSPHVLSTVDVASVRAITLDHGRGEPKIPIFQTRGVESADVLAKVMDVNPVPQVEEARWLSDYRAMVQEGEYESAAGQSLWQKLVTHFGENHPALTEVDTLRRLQVFKRANKLPLHEGN
jgi:predicted ATP-binding protein involved in virulence